VWTQQSGQIVNACEENYQKLFNTWAKHSQSHFHIPADYQQEHVKFLVDY